MLYVKIRHYLVFCSLCIAFTCFSPCIVVADQQTISLGYGLGTLNNGSDMGRLHSGGYYDFVQFAYGYEKTLSGKFNFFVEPFVSLVNRPDTGLDVGLTLNGRYYFGPMNHRGLFATIGVGGTYTSVAFEDQGTHGLFILQGGIGYKWEKIFLEARFKHYSNGGLAYPNQSVNSSILNIGFSL